MAEPRITEDALRRHFESAGRADGAPPRALPEHARHDRHGRRRCWACWAPLIGMIEIFGSQSPTGGSNPAQMAQGISVALYNTAFGLIVAIPALMFYRYFRGLVDEYTRRHGAGGRTAGAAPDALRRAPRQRPRHRASRQRMNFRKPRAEDPEINLIPFIDVLLVVLIFLMLSTTYSKFTELQVSLPIAEAEKMRERPAEIIVAVSGDGRYAVNRTAGRRAQRRSPGRRARGRGPGSEGPGGHRVGRRDVGAPVSGQRAGCGAPRRPGETDLRGPDRRRRRRPLTVAAAPAPRDGRRGAVAALQAAWWQPRPGLLATLLRPMAWLFGVLTGRAWHWHLCADP
jgi:biopolymer transport protein ExbD